MPKSNTPPPPATMRTATVGKRHHEFMLPAEGWFTPADEKPDYLRVLFFGREGSTKTTSAASMANLGQGRVLVVNAEGGLKIKPLAKRGIDTSGLAIYPPEDAVVGHKFAREELDAVFRRVASEMRTPGVWAGTVWDSSTRIMGNILDQVQVARVARYERRGMDEDNILVDPWFIDRDDYGVMSKMYRDLLRKFLDLPGHWAGTALLRREVDKDTKKPMYGPSITPGLSESLLGDPDMVIAMVGEDELGPARGLTRGNTRWRAKDRFSVLPRVMAQPTFERIHGYYTGELIEDDDPLQKDLTNAALRSFDGPRTATPAKDEEDDDE
jgi:hypothetical protein